MNYTITVNKVNNAESKTKAFASIVIDDCFKIGNISIMEGKEGKEFICMPRYKTNQVDEQGRAVYQDICFPITKEFREKLYGEIMEEYEKVKEKGKAEKGDADKAVDQGPCKTTGKEKTGETKATEGMVAKEKGRK